VLSGGVARSDSGLLEQRCLPTMPLLVLPPRLTPETGFAIVSIILERMEPKRVTLPRISLHALEAFERVAQSGSMQDAAHEMGLSISSVSHHVARLEAQLGVTLLDRSSRPFVLTREGREALRHVSAGLIHLRRATSETAIGGLARTHALRIGIVDDFENNVAPDLAVILASLMPLAKIAISMVLVVIGGGIAGCSTLYHLTQEGWSDVMLVERDELTSGTTWHSAAQVTNFGMTQTMVGLKIAFHRALQGAGGRSGLSDQLPPRRRRHPAGQHRGADGRLPPFRLDGAGMGVEFEVIDAAECARRHPLISTDNLLGGLWDPLDGDIDPAQLCQALARRARKAGAEVTATRRSPA
jgi:DNA-binding transcriptional ArsR family regulator